MAKVFEVAFKIGADMAASFAKTMSGASGALSELNKHMGEIGRQQAANQRLIDLRRDVGLAAQEFLAARSRVQELGKAIKASASPSKEMRREYEQAQMAVRKAHERLEQQRNTLRQVSEAAKATGKSTAQLVAEQNKLAQAGAKASRAQEALQKNLAARQANKQKRSELRGQLFDAVALGGSLGVVVKQAMEWEQHLAEFNKVADISNEELQRRSQEMMQIASETGIAMEQLAGAYTSAALGGLDQSEWQKFAVISAKMGVALDVTGDKAGEFLMKWQSGMGLSLDQAIELADVVNHLGNSMKAVKAADLAGVLQRQGAVLMAGGFDKETAAATMAAMLSSGAEENIAATAAKNFSLALNAGFKATKAQRGALEMLGFHDPERLAKSMQTNARETIMRVMERLRGVADHQRSAIIETLFGKESIGVITPLINNAELLAQAYGLIGDKAQYAGSLQKEYEAMAATTGNQMKRAQQSIQALSITLGSTLLPVLNQFFSKFAAVSLQFARFAQNNQWAVKAIMLTVAALIAAKVAAIAGGYAWTFIKGAMLAARGVILALRGAQLLLNAAMMANPVGLLIRAIATLIAIGVALYKNWDTVVEHLKAAWEWIKDFFANFSLFDSGKKLLETLAAGIKATAMAPVEAVKGALAKVREFLPFSDAKVGPLSELTYSGMQVMQTLTQGIRAAAAKPAEAVEAGLATVAGGLSGFVNRAANAVGIGGGGPTITLNQTVNVTGGGPGVYEQARRGAADGARDLIRDLQRALQREERLSYG